MAAGSEMDHRDEATSRALEITVETPSVWSLIKHSRCVFADLISAVITLLMNGLDYIIFKMIRRQVILRHVPPPLSDDQRSWFNCAIGRPTLRHISSRPWSPMAVDRMLQIAPHHLCAINNLQIRFKIRKFDF